jgi:hypothetical protein
MLNSNGDVNRTGRKSAGAKKMRICFHCFWLPVAVSGSSALIAGSASSVTALLFSIIAVLGIFDGICRLKEAMRLTGSRLTDRHFKLFCQSMCQRNMIIGLAGRRAAAYYRALGYRWYHMLPDVLLKEPARFFSPAFLRKNFWPL